MNRPGKTVNRGTLKVCEIHVFVAPARVGSAGLAAVFGVRNGGPKLPRLDATGVGFSLSFREKAVFASRASSVSSPAGVVT
jgi:hypothetical protein